MHHLQIDNFFSLDLLRLADIEDVTNLEACLLFFYCFCQWLPVRPGDLLMCEWVRLFLLDLHFNADRLIDFYPLFTGKYLSVKIITPLGISGNHCRLRLLQHDQD